MRKVTLNDAVFLCMRNGKWWTFWDLQTVIKEKTGVFYGEPTISAAIRNMRKSECRERYGISMYIDPITKKRISGSKGYKYKLDLGVESYGK
jgi:hypothetical protein